MKKLKIIAAICALAVAAGLAAGCSRTDGKKEKDSAPPPPSVSSLLTGEDTHLPATPKEPLADPAKGKDGGNPFVQPGANPAAEAQKPPAGSPPVGRPGPGQPGAPPGPAGPGPAGIPIERDTGKALKQVRLPLYPGAKTEEGAILGGPPGAKPGTFKASIVRISTADSFDKVVGYYRQKMPGAHTEETKREGKRQAVMELPDKKTGELQMAQVIETDSRVQVVLSRAKTPPRPKAEDIPFKVDRNAEAALKRVALPLYPGAKVEGGATETDKKNPAISRAVVVLISEDSPSKVLEFYRKELPGAREDEREIEGNRVHRLILQDGSTGGGVSVTVASIKGETRCALMKLTLPPKKQKE
ncbi:MAG: hypothetical protein KatS3mg024_2673 [Armatimonadota bacterium]|nr:MAG: hypothetical protein KatS3mg024_2673 [Armatimonadota bacterium]